MLAPERQFWLGQADDSLLLCNRNTVQAIDNTDASVKWTYPFNEETVVGAAAGAEHLLSVRLDKIDPKRNVTNPRFDRVVQWVSTATGEVVHEAQVPDGGAEVFEVDRMWAYDNKAYMLTLHPSAKNRRDGKGRLSIMEAK
jgi:hypothetical protein